MRKILMILLIGIICIACHNSGNKTSSKTNENLNIADTKQNTTRLDRLIGMYEYKYDPESSEENHYILIEKKEDRYEGRYYGTSDEFDEGREGYLPGYFVADMKDLKITNTDISFTLNVPNEKILNKKLSLKIKSFDEAVSMGYENWGNRMTLQPKEYKGKIKPDGQLFFKGALDFLDKTFIKQK